MIQENDVVLNFNENIACQDNLKIENQNDMETLNLASIKIKCGGQLPYWQTMYNFILRVGIQLYVGVLRIV